MSVTKLLTRTLVLMCPVLGPSTRWIRKPRSPRKDPPNEGNRVNDPQRSGGRQPKKCAQYKKQVFVNARQAAMVNTLEP